MRIIDLPEKTNIEKNDYIAVDQNQTITKNFKPSYLGYTPSYIIATGSDLQNKDFLNPGMYVCANEDNAKSLKNCPVSVPFIMDVYHVDETGDCTRFESSLNVQKNTKTRRVITEISTDSIDKYTQLVTTDDNYNLNFGNWTINYNQKSSIADFIYPVGAIYISMNAISPAALFGGTWEQIKDRFLLAAGSTFSAGSTGGSATHEHWYGFVLAGYYGNFVGETSVDVGALAGGAHGNPVGMGDMLADANVTINNGTQTATRSVNAVRYESRATTTAESSMPPYIVVYMWKRVA